MKFIHGRLKQPLKQITNSSAQIKDWNTPVNEVIQWKSKDGADDRRSFIETQKL